LKIGVMGGTFDPLHIGHLILAQEAGYQLKLDKILFIPAGDPPHKQNQPVTPAFHRLTMAQLATAQNPLFEVSDVEIKRQGLSYTVNTLETLSQIYAETATLYFIIGADAAAELPNWYQPRRVIELAILAVVGRPGYIFPLDKLQAALPGIEQRLVRVDTPMIEVAAQEIRQRVLEGAPIRYLVPPSVEEYIRREGLYLPPPR